MRMALIFRFRQNFLINMGGAEALGRRSEDHIRLPGERVQIVIEAALLNELEEIPVHLRIRLLHIAPGAVPDDLRLRVTEQQTDKLRSRITGRSDNSNFYHICHPRFSLRGPFHVIMYVVTYSIR